MPRFRSLKVLVRAWFRSDEWARERPLPPECYDESVSTVSLVNPLFACLTEGGDMTDRAAYALGGVMDRLHADSKEEAKNIVRRCMWHMNEESGNIGWGIPEAFGETLAQCAPLAETFRRVLLHYVYDAPEGKSTSFCDHAPLRISCYKAIACMLEARPEYAQESLPVLRHSAEFETDEACREAARALVRKYMLTAL